MKRWTFIITILFCGHISVARAAVSDSLPSSTLDTTTFVQNLLLKVESVTQTAGDAIQLNPGVFLRNTTAGGLQFVSAQGLNPQHVQILWNGVPVNSGMLGLSDLSLFTVGYRQEVGYSSNRQDLATGGLAGVVQLRSLPLLESGYRWGVRQSVGSFGQSATHLTHSGAKGKHQWALNLNADRAKNNYQFNDYTVLPNVEKRQEHAAFTRFSFSPRWHWKLTDSDRLSWYSETVFNEREIPPTLVSPMFKALQQDKTTRQQLKWSRIKANTYHEVSGTYLYNYWYYSDIVLSRVEENTENMAFLRYAGYVQIVPKWKVFYGADAKWTKVNTPNYKEGVSEYGLDVHAGTEWQALKWLNVRSLVKVSNRSRLPWYFPAMLRLNIQPGGKQDVQCWIRASTDIRFPTLNDRFWQPGGNALLQAERSISGAAGVSASWTLNERLTWKHSVETFVNRVSDMILWMPTNKFYWSPQNIGVVRAYGGVYDQQLRWQKVHHQLSATLSYAYNRSGSVKAIMNGDNTVGKQLPYFPVHSLKASGNYSWKGWLIASDVQMYSQRYVTRDEGHAIAPYQLLNLTAGYSRDWKSFGMKASISVNNLFDQYYEEVVYRPMPGRNLLFSLLINWNHVQR
jgi:vitamin B12 transporter